jgi:chromosome segregation ATPase
MKKIVLFLVFLLIGEAVSAQDTMEKLTKERATLYQKYKESESLSTGLFGNRSKDDIQATVDALNKIIDKDNEILDEIEGIQQKAKDDFTSQYNQLIQENNDLMEKNRELLSLSERHKGYSKENHQLLEATEKNQAALFGSIGLLSILMIMYMVKYYRLKSLKVKDNI